MPTSMKVSKVRALCAALVGTSLVASCASATGHEGATPQVVTVPPRAGAEIYVYAPWEQQLTSYDPQAGEVVATSSGEDFFYYAFGTPSPLYTAGSSSALGFAVLEVGRTSVRTVATVGSDEAVFPLATDGVRSFFVVYSYSRPGVESGRRIVRLEGDGSWQTYASFAGPSELVDKGVLIGDQLFYSVYDPAKDVHTVFSLPADDPGAAPTLERGGLGSGELYAFGGHLLVSDGTTIVGGPRDYRCASLCWFYDDPAVLAQITTEGADLVLSVSDAATGEELGRAPSVVGFSLESGTLVAYTRHGVQDIDLMKEGA